MAKSGLASLSLLLSIVALGYGEEESGQSSCAALQTKYCMKAGVGDV